LTPSKERPATQPPNPAAATEAAVGVAYWAAMMRAR
jgi:hypothetical protein